MHSLGFEMFVITTFHCSRFLFNDCLLILLLPVSKLPRDCRAPASDHLMPEPRTNGASSHRGRFQFRERISALSSGEWRRASPLEEVLIHARSVRVCARHSSAVKDHNMILCHVGRGEKM